MAEIGLIASVVGVTGAALAASKALYDMIDQVRNAPEEILAISRDTHSFHGIITNVHVAITDHFIVSRLGTEQQILRAVEQLEGPLENCGTILTQMRSRIKSHLKQSHDGGFRVSSFDMRWIFQRKDVMDCRNRLETTKSTLNAALSSVVFLCHLKMMGSLGHNPDALPISGLDIDAGSALREYAESIASRSPPPELDVDAGSALRENAETRTSRSQPLNATFESAARHAELPAKGPFISKQPSQEEPPWLNSDPSITADTPRTPSEVPNSDLKANTPRYAIATSFRSAIDARNIGKIKSMLAKDCDANISAADGWTALHVAVVCGETKVVQMLTDRNADVNRRTSLGMTPIHQAAREGYDEVLPILLKAQNIDVNVTTHDEWTPLHLATLNNHENSVRMFLNTENIDVNATTHNGSTPLHEAAIEGHEDIVQILLNAKNIDVNATTHYGWTSLHVAAFKGHENIVQILLNTKNIDVNAITHSKSTSLHKAAYRNHVNIVKMLLNAENIDINAKNIETRTSLYQATSFGHEKTVQILLNAKNIDVNATTTEWWTPLHIAADKNYEGIVKMLLDNDADISAKDKDGQTALIIAINNGQEDTAILLIQRGSPLINTGSHASSLYAACDKTLPRVVKALIERGKSSGQLQAMLEVTYKGYGYVPLHVAASRGSREIASQLVEAGADINVRNSFQDTPLIRAARAGQLQMVDYLIAQGADRDATDAIGREYLQVLEKNHPEKYEEHVRDLKSKTYSIRRRQHAKQ